MLIQLFIFFIFLLFIPSWYIYICYIKKSFKFWTRILFWIPDFILTIGCVYVFAIYEPYPELLHILSKLIIIYICFAIPLAVFAIVDLIMKGIYKLTRKRFYGGYIATAVALFVLVALVYGGTEGKNRFEIREKNLYFDDLPKAFDGYRIVHISDIHSGSWTDNGKALKKAVEMINNLHPDLVTFTGDIINNVSYELKPFIPILKQIKAKDGVYSVLGNHDYSPYIKWKTPELRQKNLDEVMEYERQMGWKLLNNENVKLYKENDSIALLGVENSGFPPFPNYGNLPKAIKGTEDMFQILMSHDPNRWESEIVKKTKIKLTLSGHTHNMQISILGFSPSMFVYKQHNGLYEENKQKIFVNIGLGHLMFPMRLGAWPEITLITLKSNKNG